MSPLLLPRESDSADHWATAADAHHYPLKPTRHYGSIVNLAYLDLTALGRQEEWEDSPEGYPQTPPYQWWNLHDEYEQGD